MDQVSPEDLTDVALTQLAEIARIPTKNLAQFEGLIRPAIKRGLLAYAQAGENAHGAVPMIRPQTVSQLANVEDAAKKLHDVLESLDDDAMKWFARFVVTGEEYGFPDDKAAMRFNVNDVILMSGVHAPSKVGALKSIVKDWESAAASTGIYAAERGRRSHLPIARSDVEIGRAGLDNLDAFDWFALDVYDACSRTGGKLTVAKNTPDQPGTFAKFLQTTARFLPSGFIPSALTLSRLQQIKSSPIAPPLRRPL